MSDETLALLQRCYDFIVTVECEGQDGEDTQSELLEALLPIVFADRVEVLGSAVREKDSA